jgi:hypothetical protein
MIDIRPLFPVDFDGDIIPVEKLGYFLILKRLPLHNMAPMTSK